MDDMETTKKADTTVDSLGLPKPKRPADSVVLLDWPQNIGDITSDQLAEHMSWWSGWSGYARYHLARAETNLHALKAEYKFRYNEAMSTSSLSYKSVTAAKSAIEHKPELIALLVRIETADAIVRHIKALLEDYEAKYAVVSREISRRKADIDD